MGEADAVSTLMLRAMGSQTLWVSQEHVAKPGENIAKEG